MAKKGCNDVMTITDNTHNDVVSKPLEGTPVIPTSVSNEDEKVLLLLSDDDVQINYRNILGRGAFCTVFSVQVKPFETSEQQQQPLALKQLNLHIRKDDKICKFATLDMKREADILSKLSRHDNIIQLHGVRKDDADSKNSSSFFIVMALLVDTLGSKLETWRQNRGWFEAVTPYATVVSRLEHVAIGIANGMAYLHSKHIVFRDLKPDNVGFDHNGTIKLFDFGLAHELSPTGTTMGRIGTLRYMAPEVAAKEEPYGLKADVFSFAILLWEIVTNRVPYEAEISNFKPTTPQVDSNARPPLNYIESKELQELIRKAWAAIPEDRPTFPEIIVELRRIIQTPPPPKLFEALWEFYVIGS